jgi:hypothetical protein
MYDVLATTIPSIPSALIPDDAPVPYSSYLDLSNHLKKAFQGNSFYSLLLGAPQDLYNSSDLRLRDFVSHQ